jgi:hypothetical protein
LLEYVGGRILVDVHRTRQWLDFARINWLLLSPKLRTAIQEIQSTIGQIVNRIATLCIRFCCDLIKTMMETITCKIRIQTAI